MPNLLHALVSKVDRATNTDKMYILDLVRIGSSNIHYLVRRWGRRHTGSLQVKAERFEGTGGLEKYRSLLDEKYNEGYGVDPQGITADVLEACSMPDILSGQIAVQAQNDIAAWRESERRAPTPHTSGPTVAPPTVARKRKPKSATPAITHNALRFLDI